MHGMNILIDPMFSERSSPFQWIGPKRFSRPSTGVEQLPHIDIVLITHDHYDYLDRLTISQLNAKTDRCIVPLGVENHLKLWHISAQKITSLAWWEQANINRLEITCAPSRHFSGRRLVRHDTTLWCSWVLRNEYHSIFDSGDGSFGGHFKEIHDRFGNFDFALMECGQYNKNWHHSHLYPEETVMDAKIIGAKKVMPIHWGAFILSNHGWDDPPECFVREAQNHGLSIVTPHLCETICIDGEVSTSYWWREYN